MTAIIKQSISHLSAEVNDLKARSAGTAAANKQAKQHSTSVINSLHTTLKKTTSEFMNVVKARRQVSRDMLQGRVVCDVALKHGPCCAECGGSGAAQVAVWSVHCAL